MLLMLSSIHTSELTLFQLGQEIFLPSRSHTSLIGESSEVRKPPHPQHQKGVRWAWELQEDGVASQELATGDLAMAKVTEDWKIDLIATEVGILTILLMQDTATVVLQNAGLHGSEILVQTQDYHHGPRIVCHIREVTTAPDQTALKISEIATGNHHCQEVEAPAGLLAPAIMIPIFPVMVQTLQGGVIDEGAMTETIAMNADTIGETGSSMTIGDGVAAQEAGVEAQQGRETIVFANEIQQIGIATCTDVDQRTSYFEPAYTELVNET